MELMIDKKIACVWAITFSDEQIWEERNKDAAIYIHRIAANPEFRGKNLIAVIVTRAKEYAKTCDKDFIRLDTPGNNINLIQHYTNTAFDFLGMFDLKDTTGLQGNYRHNDLVCLFEIEL